MVGATLDLIRRPNRVQSVAEAIMALSGWRRLGAAFVAGAVSAFALPPFLMFPLLWLTVPVVVWLIDGTASDRSIGLLRRLAAAAAVGWAFGFGYLLAGLWWLGAAFLVQTDHIPWLMPLAVVAFPAALGLFWALGAVLARLFWSPGWSRLVVFAVAMAIPEWLRGHILTGFPWNAFGYALAPVPVMMQTASLVGLWGLTFAAFFIFAAPAALARTGGEGRWPGRLVLAVAVLMFLAHIGYGVIRLPPGPIEVVADEQIRIIQPDIPQADKWQLENADRILDEYITLSSGPPTDPGAPAPTILVWPESAFPFLLAEHPEAIARIDELLLPEVILITGAARGEAAREGLPGRLFNSVYVIGDEGEFLDAYDKKHLVPFGEYLPFRKMFEAVGIEQLVPVPGGFTAGTSERAVSVPEAPPFRPLICYEIIFPDDVVDDDDRPQWLVSVSNDAWFGRTPGPYQHFEQARLRAVEEGLPLVRAANNGLSGIIDGYGRIVGYLGLDVAGVVDGPLPAALPVTPYARFGDLIFWVMVVAATVVAVVARFSRVLTDN